MTTRTAPATRKQSLAAAVRIARTPGTELHRALCGLDGCPDGGWGETAQARGRIADALPLMANRSYATSSLIAAVMTVDHAGRWRWA